MSFSSEVKAEACRQALGDPGCQLAELSAALHAGGGVALEGSGRLGFFVVTESPAVARRLFMLLKTRVGVRPRLAMSDVRTHAAAHHYKLSATHSDGATRALEELGILRRPGGGGLSLRPGVPPGMLASAAQRKAYLRGALLTAGSMSDPASGYRLEFVLSSEEYAASLSRLLKRCAVKHNAIKRRDNTVLYVTEAESIESILSMTGAHTKLMEISNLRIVRGMRADANRAVNCETANIGKTMRASEKQIAAFERLSMSAGAADLPDELRDMLLLRLSHPEASLSDLADLTDPPLTKSGVMHRVKRLMTLAENLPQKEENE